MGRAGGHRPAAPLREMEATGGADTASLVVVNYGSSALLAQNLGRIDLTGLPVRVVVVDNHSSTAELAAVHALAGERGWTVVALPDNRGFGAAVNAGTAAARRLGCRVHVLLNPDATLVPAVLAALHQHVLTDPLAVVSPTVVTSAGAVEFSGARVVLGSGRIRGGAAARRDDLGPTRSWLTGACLAVHDDVLRRAGGFAEDYFLYWEDVDFSRRCELAGATLVVRDDLVAVHDEGGTQPSGPGRAKSALYYRYNCRNRLVYAARQLDRAGTVRWLLRTPVESWQVLLRGGRRQLLADPGLLLAALSGSASGAVVALRSLVRPQRAGLAR